MWGWVVALLVRASDLHTANAGSIPCCGKGFFSQSQLSVQTLLRCLYTPVHIACIYVCGHVKDPVVHVRVGWIMATQKHPACTIGWEVRLCRSWLSLRKAPQISQVKKKVKNVANFTDGCKDLRVCILLIFENN